MHHVVVAIDDNQTALDSVRLAARYLTRQVSVLTATRAVDGLALIQEHATAVRVVVLDVHLPQVDGRWLGPEIRRIAPQVQIIPFTADADAGYHLMELGCRPPLCKPITPMTIAAALEQALTDDAPPAPPQNPLAAFVAQVAPRILQRAREEQGVIRMVLVAQSRLLRMGLRSQMNEIGESIDIVEDTDQVHEVRQKVHSTRVSIIVCAMQDGQDEGVVRAVQSAAREAQVPLLIYATSAGAARLVRDTHTNLIVDPVRSEELSSAIRIVVAGGKYQTDRGMIDRLTPQQQLLLKHVAAGKSPSAIALDMDLTYDRVRHLLSAVYQRLDVENFEALREWLRAMPVP